MKHQCHMSVIYLSWALSLGGIAFLLWRSLWVMAVALAVAIPAGEWIYIRKFRVAAPVLGYGSISDDLAAATKTGPVKVTLYTAVGCPFCPLIEERLVNLKKQAGFDLEVLDVTLRPHLLVAKGIRSVPKIGRASCRERV